MPVHQTYRYFYLGLLGFTMMCLLAPQVQSAQQTQTIPANKQPSIGIALGAGGANGLAHILMLEVLDEMNIRPKCMAGSSIGAIIGGLYASGISAKQIRELVEQFIISPDEKVIEQLINSETLRWIDFIEVELGNGGLLSSEGFLSFLYEKLKKQRFEELEIPLKIIAGDLWNRQQVVLDSGALLPAIKASMALPGVFEPVMLDNRVLVDGGTVNPVPYDLLTSECEIVIGIDVSGQRSQPVNIQPGYFDTIFNSAKVMQQAIMAEKLQRQKPAIYLVPQLVDIRALEFYRASEIFKQAAPAKQELKRRLLKLLGK